LFNTKVTNLNYGVTTFRWTVSDKGCVFSDNVNITNLAIYANAGSDQIICKDNTIITGNDPLAANDPNIGSGLWTLLSGTANIVNASNFNTNITNVGPGPNSFRWTISENGCADYDDVQIVNNTVFVNAGLDQSVCTNSAILAGNQTGTGSGVWTRETGIGVISTPTLYNTSVNGLGYGANTFRWTISDNSCVGFDDVIITNHMYDVDAGGDQTLCRNFTTLLGNNPGPGTGKWTIQSGSGTIANNTNFNTVVSDLSNGTSTFRWTITIATCNFSDDVAITNNSFLVDAGIDEVVCGITTQLTAGSPTGGGSGLWTVNSGSATFVNNTLNNTVVNDLGPGNNALLWTITQNGCTVSDQVIITNGLPSDATTGPDVALCSNTGTLIANDPTIGVGRWTLVAGGGSIADPLANATQVTNLTFGTNTFRWTIQDQGNNCATYDDMVITNNSFVVDAGVNQTTCDGNSTLNGSQPFVGGQGVWSVLSGAGTFTSPTLFNSPVTGLNTGQNKFQWTVTWNGCTATDIVTITNYSVTASAGVDQILCKNNTLLEGNDPLTNTGLWSVVTGEAAIVYPTLFNTPIVNMSEGTVTLRWTITGQGGCVDNDDVIITNNAVTVDAGLDKLLCADNTELQGNNPFPGLGTWALITGTGTIVNNTQFNTQVTNLGGGASLFRWTVTKNGCSGYDEVLVTNNSLTVSAGADAAICSDSYTFAGSAPGANGTGLWTKIAGAGTLTTPTLYYSSVTALGEGANTFRWQVTRNGCTASDLVIIRNNSIQVSAGIDKSVCDTMTVLSGSVPGSGGYGIWTLESGAGNFVNASVPNTEVHGLAKATNSFRWTVNRNGCIASDVVLITNNLPDANAGLNQVLCQDYTILEGNELLDPAASGVWTLYSGSGDLETPTRYYTDVTDLGEGANTFIWTVSQNGCFASDEVTIVNNSVVAFAGPDKELCQDYYNISGNNPGLGSGLWSVEGGFGIVTIPTLYNTTVTNLANGSTTLRWTISENGCSAFDDMIVINNLPTVAVVPPDYPVCENNAVLTGNAPIEGDGIWTNPAGSGTIVNPTAFNTDVINLGVGNNTFRWTISNGICNSFDELVITNNTVSVNVGLPQYVCGTTSTLYGSNPGTGHGLWTTVGGYGEIENPTYFSTKVNNLGQGLNQFEWTIARNGCVASSIAEITNNLPTIADVVDSIKVCSGEALLVGNQPLVGHGLWYVSSGAGNITNPTLFSTTITTLGVGINEIIWSISLNGCSSSDTVVIVNGAVNAYAGQDYATCEPSAMLTASAPVYGAVGIWTVTGGQGTFVTPTLNTTLVTNLGSGANTLKWTVSKGECVASDQVVITNNLPTQAVTQPEQTICTNYTTLIANSAVYGTGIWSVEAGSGTFANASAFITNITNIGPNYNLYRWTITQGDCVSYAEVVINNNAVEANAGIDREVCGTESFLFANDPAPNAGIWTTNNGTGSIVIVNPTNNNTEVLNLNTGTNTFTWTVSGTGANTCTASDIMIITNNLFPANAGGDQVVCIDEAFLVANNPPIGSGVWSVDGGGGTFDNPTMFSTTIRDLGQGSNTLVWNVIQGGCQSTDTVVITNNMVEAFAGGNQIVCHNYGTLTGNEPQVGTGIWTLQGGTGTIAEPFNHQTDVTNLGYGANTFKWTISANGCIGTDQTIISNNAFSISAGGNQVICGTSAQLNAGDPGNNATGIWTIVGGTGAFANATIFNTVVTSVGAGNNQYQWTVTKNGCSASGVTIVRNDLYPAIAGNDQIICNSFTFMNATPPISGNGQWAIMNGSATFANATLPNTMVTGIGAGLNTLLWSVTNNACTSHDQIVINNSSAYVNPGTDFQVCDNFAYLNAALEEGSTGLWELVSGSGVIDNPTAVTTLVSNLQNGANTFEWTVNNGVCTGSDLVTVYNNSLLIGPGLGMWAGADQTIQGSTATLNAEIPNNSTCSWQVLSGSGDFQNPTSPTTDVFEIGFGANHYRLSVVNGICTSVDDVIIYRDFINVNAGPNGNTCSDSVQLSGNVPTLGTGMWSVVSGGPSTIIETPTAYNTWVHGLQQGVNTFRWSITYNGYTVYDDVTITNRSFTLQSYSNEICVDHGELWGDAPSTEPGANGVGSWSLQSGGGTVVNSTYFNSPVTNLSIGTNVFLWTVTQWGCQATSTFTFTRFEQSVADFAPVDTAGCSPFVVPFNNLSINDNTWVWNFGDGYSEDVENPTHTYINTTVAPVTNIVRLVAVSPNGCKDTVFHNVTVYPEVQFDFSAAPQLQTYPETTVFLDYFGDINYSQYYWDFGDNNNMLGLMEQYSYTTWGEFNISLAVENQWGCSDTVIKSVVILPPPPVAAYEANIDEGCEDLSVTFTNLSAFKESSTFAWDFGDGGTSTEVEPTYIYTTPGLWRVTLTQTGPGGQTDVAINDTIWVHALPTPDFDVAPDSIMLPDFPVRYFNFSSEDAVAFLWFFGDDSTSTERDPIHYYQEIGPIDQNVAQASGYYDVKLVVWTEFGCSDSLVIDHAVYVQEEGEIIFPNAFTPNQTMAADPFYVNTDSHNDVFHPLMRGVDPANYTLQIFNRWGQMIFETTDPLQGWNGYYKDKLAPQDVYVWRVTGKFVNGVSFEEAGDVTLIR